MKIVIAPDSFKGTLSAAEACAAIAAGLRRVLPDAELVEAPLADGGEGTADAVVCAMGGVWRECRVHGPLGDPVTARFGLIDEGRTAIVEMAAASGLTLVSRSRRDVLAASTFGTGELIAAAAGAHARRILVAIGGSATCDGGCGMAQAVGVRFLNQSGEVLPERLGGGDLGRIDAIDPSRILPALRATEVEVLCDVRNPLTGPRGAAQVYAPQKGANAEEVALLDRGLAHLAELIHRDLGLCVDTLPGAGAAGGLGAGLVAFLGAQLCPGADTVMRYVDFDSRCQRADAILTGEGRLDPQSLEGKVVSAVADAGRRNRCPVYVLAGQVDLPEKVWKAFAGVAAIAESAHAPAAPSAAHALAERAAEVARIWFVRE